MSGPAPRGVRGRSLPSILLGALAGALALAILAAALAFGLLVFVFVVPFVIAALVLASIFGRGRFTVRRGGVFVERRRFGGPSGRVPGIGPGDVVTVHATSDLDATGVPVGARYRVIAGEAEVLDTADEREARALAERIARTHGCEVRLAGDEGLFRKG